jgi:hypothetical protein
MSVITAYKCDSTGKLFEDKAKYQNTFAKLPMSVEFSAKSMLHTKLTFNGGMITFGIV